MSVISFSGHSVCCGKFPSVDETMDLLFNGVKEDASECPFDVKDLQRCPFLRNINKPTCFSFSSVHLPLSVIPGAKGPIFEDGPSFDTAFKVFHGKNGIVPLSGRSNVRDDVPDFKPTPYFNPLATKAATISLSSFGPGGPFSFGPFSDKWKKQKKPDSSSNKNSSSSPEGSSSKHEALGNEWLKSGNCPIAKSYRAVSHVLPLVASALQPPPGMKFKCPPAVVAARAALARTAFVKSLRPQPLPAKILVIAALGMAVNVPLGVWREHTTKFSLSWFTAVHAAVPFIAMLRKSVLMPKTAMALTIAASVLGQVIGSRAERFRLKQVAERGGSTVQIATAGAIPGYSPTLVDGVTVTERGQRTLQIASASAIAGYSASQVDCGAGTHCGAEGMMCNPLPLEGSGPTSPENVCF